MHISIIVPAYNVAGYIGEAISSVIGQTYTEWSMVIVDDGSTDSTASSAASFDDPRIRILHQPHAGVSTARNTGLTAGARDAVLFLDADDWLAPNALQRLSDTLLDAPWATAACGSYSRVSPLGRRRAARLPPQGLLLDRLVTRNLFANGGHLLIRREAIIQAGLFNPDLTYGEDWEYWTRLALTGEFTAVPGRAPVLFVRERPGSAYLGKATDPTFYQAAIDAIYRNPAVVFRLGRSRLQILRPQAQAEAAWAIGRELIRHGHHHDGQQWLGRSLRQAPSLKRIAMIALAWLQYGPFRPYETQPAPG